ncbi:hypothetical protein DW068_10705 [Anaerobutyricum hallii]|uniref:Uncharacterized protein n=1 Tax=Anaerobutyricum hallii TaxID=39488 RepID=A0A415G5W4_9FIRM|nr:hypothetical protein DW068_10705 [Anaerobutyricum hallii]RHN08190.1 hypothetical protein DWZ29_14875 [Anaerobutyricum hallii]
MTDRRSRREKISYICGLGAKVGCEHISEHSTCSDESHKYRFFLFLVASTLPFGKSEAPPPLGGGASFIM